MSLPSVASEPAPVSRALTPQVPPQILSLLRGTLMTLILLLSLLALGLAGARLLPGWLPERAWSPAQRVAGPTASLLGLLGALMGGMAMLSGLRVWETRAERARAERYRARSREWQESQREQTETTRAERDRSADAILIIDLVQSTELLAEHGDVFFRDLLRRIEVAFIPVARRWHTRAVDGHGDGFLFCFAEAGDALQAVREMYERLPAINQELPGCVEVAFRASLHVGPTFADSRGNPAGLAVLKTARLGAVMESLYGRGEGRNTLTISDEARAALGPAGAVAKPLGPVALRGFPGTHQAYEIDL